MTTGGTASGYDQTDLDLDMHEEVGSSGLMQFAGIVDEEWLTELRGLQGVRVYREMADNSPIIGALLYLIKSLVQQTPRRIDPAAGHDVDKQQATDAAEFLESCLGDMSNTMEDLLCEILTMLPYGWAYFERVYKMREGETDDGATNSRYNDGMVGLRKIAIRSQGTLSSWVIDDDGGIRGMWQIAPPHYRLVFLPIEKCVLFRTETTLNNPEGRSYLRNAYTSYYHVRKLTEFESIGVERDCTGIPVMEVPPALLADNASTADKRKAASLKKLVQQIRRGAREGLLTPCEELPNGKKSGYKLRPYSGGGSRQFDIGDIIKRHEQRIAMVVLAEFLLIGLDKVGSYSLVSNKTDLFAVALGTLLARIASTFNRYVVEPLMRINGFEQSVWPAFAFGDIEAPDLGQLISYIKGLSDIDALSIDDNLKRKLREMANLPPAPEREGGEDDEGTTPTAGAGAGAPGAPTENVQQTALNGAQVTSLTQIVQQVATGLLPRDSGIALITTAFPVSPQQAEAIMGSVGQGFVPTVPGEPVKAAGPATSSATASPASSPVRASTPPSPVPASSVGGARIG